MAASVGLAENAAVAAADTSGQSTSLKPTVYDVEEVLKPKRMIFGTLSGPGATYGLSLTRFRLICSLEMGSISQMGLGYTTKCSGASSGALGEEDFCKHDALASIGYCGVSWPSLISLRMGILDLLLSPAGVGVYLWAVQMSGSSTLSNQFRQ